jgi:putative aldouronate transport system substrate-binding protein
MEDDGKQYGMTSRRAVTEIAHNNMFIRQDWLDKFGMNTPTTVDEVVTFMRRVRDEDPDGNGIKDTWGIGSRYNLEMNLLALFGRPRDGFLVVNGHFVDWYSTPGYRGYLDFMAMIYREGFLDPEYITHTTDYSREYQLFATGKVGLYMRLWDPEPEWRDLKKNVPEANLQPMEPFTTSQGKHGLYREAPPEAMICMNKDTKNAQALMAFADWSLTDGWFTLTYGQEGRHYRLVNGIPQTIDTDLNLRELTYAFEYGRLFHQKQVTSAWFPVQAAQDPLSQEYAALKGKSLDTVFKCEYDSFVPFAPTSDSINRFANETQSQIAAIETNIMTGKIPVDEGLRQINEYKKSFGWDAVNAEKDAWYQKNKHLFQ